MTTIGVTGSPFVADQAAYRHEATRPGAATITVPAVLIGGQHDGASGLLLAVRTRDGRVTFPGLMGMRLPGDGPWHVPLRVCHQRPDGAWALHGVGATVCSCPSHTPLAPPAPDPVAPAGYDLGHTLTWDPPAATGAVQRWSCPCGAYVLRAGETIYGSATVTPCHLADERLDRALASAPAEYAAALRALVTIRAEHRPDGAGDCVRCESTPWPCHSRVAVATAIPHTHEGGRP